MLISIKNIGSPRNPKAIPLCCRRCKKPIKAKGHSAPEICGKCLKK